MKDVLKAILTIWYFVLGIAFLFLFMVSAAVFIGLVGGGDNAWWVGLGGSILYWKASSIYRGKFLERIEHTKKADLSHWDDDDDKT